VTDPRKLAEDALEAVLKALAERDAALNALDQMRRERDRLREPQVCEICGCPTPCGCEAAEQGIDLRSHDYLARELDHARAERDRLQEAIASALTSLATGPGKDDYAYQVLDAALADIDATSKPEP
jgi:hypothetical protein